MNISCPLLQQQRVVAIGRGGLESERALSIVDL